MTLILLFLIYSLAHGAEPPTTILEEFADAQRINEINHLSGERQGVRELNRIKNQEHFEKSCREDCEKILGSRKWIEMVDLEELRTFSMELEELLKQNQQTDLITRPDMKAVVINVTDEYFELDVFKFFCAFAMLRGQVTSVLSAQRYKKLSLQYLSPSESVYTPECRDLLLSFQNYCLYERPKSKKSLSPPEMLIQQYHDLLSAMEAYCVGNHEKAERKYNIWRLTYLNGPNVCAAVKERAPY